MISSLGFAIIVCFLVGTATVVALAVKTGSGRTDGTIARVLYEAEQEKRR